jgi:hypothetical protein
MCGGTAGAFTEAFCLACPTCTPGRIYPTVATENTQLPFIIYTAEANGGDITLTSDAGVMPYTITIDVLANTFQESRLAAIAVNNAFNFWRDLSVNVLLCRLQSSASIFEDETGLYHYQISYSLNHRNT